MGTHIKTDGFFYSCVCGATPGKVLVSFTSDTTHETLSFSFGTKGQITINYLPARVLVQIAREKLAYALSQRGKPVIEYITFRTEAPGLYNNQADGKYLSRGHVAIHYKANTFTGVLSLAFEEKGTILVPIESIEALVQMERRRFLNASGL